jgi:hypothetical protein
VTVLERLATRKLFAEIVYKQQLKAQKLYLKTVA